MNSKYCERRSRIAKSGFVIPVLKAPGFLAVHGVAACLLHGEVEAEAVPVRGAGAGAHGDRGPEREAQAPGEVREDPARRTPRRALLGGAVTL